MNRLLPVPVLLLVLLLLAAPGAAAETTRYDLIVTSSTFEPGSPVIFVVLGRANESFSIRVVDASDSSIVHGRDNVVLDPSGQMNYSWTPGQAGSYNVTVDFASGVKLTRGFLVQRVVDEADLGQIYTALFRIQNELLAEIQSLRGMVNMLAIVSAVAIIISVSMMLHARKLVNSRANSSLERLLATRMDELFAKVKKQDGK